MAFYAKTIEKVKNTFDAIVKLVHEQGKDGEINNYIRGIIPLIMRECALDYVQALKIMNLLTKNGYLQLITEGRKIVIIKLLKTEWNGLPKEEIKEKKREKHTQQKKVLRRHTIHPLREKAPEHCAVMLVDWSNLAESLNYEAVIDKLINLEKKLVENNTIIEAKFVFIPEHRVEAARKLSTIYRYICIVCPRSFNDRNNNPIFKDKDTVDALLTKLGEFISLCSSWITHLVLVGGDGDFVELAMYAKNHGKKFIVASLPGQLSRALEKTADDLIILSK